MKGIKLEKNKVMSLKNNIVVSVKPKYVYLPVKEGYSLLVKNGDHVLKNMNLEICDNGVSIVSSVSGTVVEIGDYIKIENDFLEETETVDTDNIDKDKFIKLLKDSGIVGMGGAGFPTYRKYDTDKIKTLIVNAVECEPYITSDYALAKTKAKEIVEAIELVMKINNIQLTYIAVKKHNYNIDKFFSEFLKENIKLIEVPNIYPAGWERTLIKYVMKVDYDKIPLERGIVVNNLATIYAIGELLKGNKLTERIITVTGNVKKPGNYLVKIGTPISEIISEAQKINESDFILSGGPMMGDIITNDYVKAQTNCILVLDSIKSKMINCLRCGKCSDICPVKINPVLIKDNMDDIEKLNKLNALKCIECGLCSYICPSKINLKEQMIEAKAKIRKVKI